MASIWTQTKGLTKFGPTAGAGTIDYSAYVTSCGFEQEADQLDVPATYATGEVGAEPGPKARRMQINYLSDSALTGLFDEFETAFEGDTVVFFEVTFKIGTVSATNPKFTGQLVIDQVSIGGTRGDIRQSSVTYPIKAGTFARAIV